MVVAETDLGCSSLSVISWIVPTKRAETADVSGRAFMEGLFERGRWTNMARYGRQLQGIFPMCVCVCGLT